jgi:hypothetical protein
MISRSSLSLYFVFEIVFGSSNLSILKALEIYFFFSPLVSSRSERLPSSTWIPQTIVYPIHVLLI